MTETADRLLRRLEWQVIRRLDGLLQGDYRTLFYGVGIDFADLREYQLQDDIRHIDWNVTARMNAPFVRQFVEDRELTAWFLLDRSPSMQFGLEKRPKSRLLAEFVLILAQLLSRSGNRLGAILYNNSVEQTLPPRGGRRQVLRLGHQLLKPVAHTGQATDLSGLLYAGLNSIKRRSLIFLLSDFISEPGWERPLTLLAQRHELIPIRLWDAREVSLPDAGIIYLEDAETGEQILVDTGDPLFRQRFQTLVQEREATLQASLRKTGVDLYSISTADSLVAALTQLITLRKKRARGR